MIGKGKKKNIVGPLAQTKCSTESWVWTLVWRRQHSLAHTVCWFTGSRRIAVQRHRIEPELLQSRMNCTECFKSAPMDLLSLYTHTRLPAMHIPHFYNQTLVFVRFDIGGYYASWHLNDIRMSINLASALRVENKGDNQSVVVSRDSIWHDKRYTDP